MKQMVIVVDLDRCIGCHGGCQVACKTENNISLGKSRSTLYTVGPTGTYPNIQMYFMALMCQQCENPACAQVCPTGACYKDSEDGVVYIDKEQCIGCQSCIKACPYEAIYFNKELRVSDKCTICVQRRENGEVPACVKNCAGGALHFGDINDPESEVSKILAEAGEENVYALPDQGNKPSGRFILRRGTWHDVLPNKCDFVSKSGLRTKRPSGNQ